MKLNPGKKAKKTPGNKQLPGYLVYPADEDIYSKAIEVPYKETEDSPLDMGLDIPGSELDDANELLGEEDEENNYYSLGDNENIDMDENNDER